jgi:hypothetical protein
VPVPVHDRGYRLVYVHVIGIVTVCVNVLGHGYVLDLG